MAGKPKKKSGRAVRSGAKDLAPRKGQSVSGGTTRKTLSEKLPYKQPQIRELEDPQIKGQPYTW